MQVYVLYSRAELHEAAKYIWENNPHVKNWPEPINDVVDMVKYIKRNVRRYALQNAHVIHEERITGIEPAGWLSIVGTGGFYLSYHDDSDSKEPDIIRIGVNILINPAVSCLETGHTDEYITDIE